MTLTSRSSCSFRLIRAEFKVPFPERLAPKISSTSRTLSSLPAAPLFPQSQLQPISVHELPSSPMTICSASCDVILKPDSLTSFSQFYRHIWRWSPGRLFQQKISFTASCNSSPERTLQIPRTNLKQKPRKNLNQKPKENLGKTRDLGKKET